MPSYAEFWRSSLLSVRFGVRCGRPCSKTIAAQAVWHGGEGRNRTMSSPAASLNTLIHKGILTLIPKGFKRFLALHATYRL
jgi:hypothetical protein